MYADLPDNLKRKVLERLMADDFTAAKEIHDHWMAEQDSIKYYEFSKFAKIPEHHFAGV